MNDIPSREIHFTAVTVPDLETPVQVVSDLEGNAEIRLSSDAEATLSAKAAAVGLLGIGDFVTHLILQELGADPVGKENASSIHSAAEVLSPEELQQGFADLRASLKLPAAYEPLSASVPDDSANP